MFWGEKMINQWTPMIQKTLANSKPKITAVLGMNEWVLCASLMFSITKKFIIDQNTAVNQI